MEDNIIVLDTETAGMTNLFVYDMGYCVYSPTLGRIVARRDFIIREVFNNKPLMLADFAAAKLPWYENLIAAKKSRLIGWKGASHALRRDINNYHVKLIYAYNAPFDYRAIGCTTANYKILGGRFKKIPFNPTLDITMRDIMRTPEMLELYKSQAYIDFCKENEFMTKTNKPSRTAETVYRFMSGNLEFVEEHTALSDSEIETRILAKIKGWKLDGVKPL